MSDFLSTPHLEDYAQRAAGTGGRREGGKRIAGQGPGQAVTGLPRVSVITVVRNGAAVIEQTIQSVLRQGYENIEYIIIDGASSDATLDVVRKYEDRIDFWLSEPDAGISDAFNKGIALARGEIIGLLNAGDRYHEDAVHMAVDNFRCHPGIGFSFGDCVYVEDGVPRFVIRGDAHYARRIASRMPTLNHPTVFVKRAVYERLGLYATGYKIAMDYDFLLRCHRHGVAGRSVGAVVAYMDYAGVSRRQFRQALGECRHIAVRHGRAPIPALATYWTLLSKTVIKERLERLGLERVVAFVKRRINPHYREFDGHAGR